MEKSTSFKIRILLTSCLILISLLSCQTDKVLDDANTYSLTLKLDPAEAGNVSGGGKYQEGEPVILSVAIKQNFEFVSWKTSSGEIISEEGGIIFTMPASDLSLIATIRRYE